MKVSLSQHIQTYFIREVNSLINDTPNHLIVAANVICEGIELLGKIYDTTCDLNEPYKARKHFEDALQKFKSLNKYGNVKNGEGKSALYCDVRCSFSHGLMNGEYINLAPTIKQGITMHNGKGIIGIKELYTDFVIACQEILTSTDKTIQARLSNTMYDVFPIGT